MATAVDNPPNPFHRTRVEWEVPQTAGLEVVEERAVSIVARNDSPDVGFDAGVNPYRGCQHGCAYCYARPTHQYLDFGAGTDFEKRIVAKVNAPELLRETFLRPSWRGETLAFSGATDCYQPIEARYRLTRRCLAVCAEFRNPVGIVTKNSLVLRDLDLLHTLAEEASVVVHLSIPFSDPDLARAIEPYAPPPEVRFRTLEALAEAGIPVGVGVAPIIPGLNDDQIVTILTRAAAAGARSAFRIALRLPAEVRPVFLSRLEKELPLRARKVEAAVREMRGGRLNDPRFGKRMEGAGRRWLAITDLFDLTCRRLGLNHHQDYGPAEPPSTFRRPGAQLDLFS
jgi:DNA repair photolyase